MNGWTNGVKRCFKGLVSTVFKLANFNVASFTSGYGDVPQFELIFALPNNKEGDWRVDPHGLVEGHVQVRQLLNAFIVWMIEVLKCLKPNWFSEMRS